LKKNLPTDNNLKIERTLIRLLKINKEKTNQFDASPAPLFDVECIPAIIREDGV
jgi:hypothetical protein